MQIWMNANMDIYLQLIFVSFNFTLFQMTIEGNLDLNSGNKPQKSVVLQLIGSQKLYSILCEGLCVDDMNSNKHENWIQVHWRLSSCHD